MRWNGLFPVREWCADCVNPTCQWLSSSPCRRGLSHGLLGEWVNLTHRICRDLLLGDVLRPAWYPLSGQWPIFPISESLCFLRFSSSFQHHNETTGTASKHDFLLLRLARLHPGKERALEALHPAVWICVCVCIKDTERERNGLFSSVCFLSQSFPQLVDCQRRADFIPHGPTI